MVQTETRSLKIAPYDELKVRSFDEASHADRLVAITFSPIFRTGAGRLGNPSGCASSRPKRRYNTFFFVSLGRVHDLTPHSRLSRHALGRIYLTRSPLLHLTKVLLFFNRFLSTKALPPFSRSLVPQLLVSHLLSSSAACTYLSTRVSQLITFLFQ